LTEFGHELQKGIDFDHVMHYNASWTFEFANRLLSNYAVVTLSAARQVAEEL
jgi:hypothetical protein